MQYHRDGFRPGDPDIEPADDTAAVADGHDLLDVLIVGSGPAGLTLATQLCAYSGLRLRVVERNPGPLEFGRADGVACRSMEMVRPDHYISEVLPLHALDLLEARLRQVLHM